MWAVLLPGCHSSTCQIRAVLSELPPVMFVTIHQRWANPGVRQEPPNSEPSKTSEFILPDKATKAKLKLGFSAWKFGLIAMSC